MKNVCGLDFGTSNTISSTYLNNKNQLVPLEGNNFSLPSAVYFPFDNIKQPIYGDNATNIYINNGYGRYMKSFKRTLGTSFFEQGTILKPGYRILFRDIIVAYIKHVKHLTEKCINNEVDYVVIGKPVRLNNDRLKLNSGVLQLESILKEVGYKNYSLLEEPIAAAFYHKNKIKNNSIALVADLGGGTCDFTTVETNDNKLKILATSGITLGGTDLDSSFALNNFYPELGYKSIDKFKGVTLSDKPYRAAADWNNITTQLYTPKIDFLVKKMITTAKEKDKVLQFYDLVVNKKAHSLLTEIENTKISLSNTEKIIFNSTHIPNTIDLKVTKNAFEISINAMVAKIIKTAGTCCELSQTKKESIKYLILTGGSSKIPLVKNLFKVNFPNAELIENNSMDSVALGLLEKAKYDFL